MAVETWSGASTRFERWGGGGRPAGAPWHSIPAAAGSTPAGITFRAAWRPRLFGLAALLGAGARSRPSSRVLVQAKVPWTDMSSLLSQPAAAERWWTLRALRDSVARTLRARHARARGRGDHGRGGGTGRRSGRAHGLEEKSSWDALRVFGKMPIQDECCANNQT